MHPYSTELSSIKPLPAAGPQHQYRAVLAKLVVVIILRQRFKPGRQGGLHFSDSRVGIARRHTTVGVNRPYHLGLPVQLRRQCIDIMTLRIPALPDVTDTDTVSRRLLQRNGQAKFENMKIVKFPLTQMLAILPNLYQHKRGHDASLSRVQCQLSAFLNRGNKFSSACTY